MAHSFRAQGFCTIPVCIRVKNTSPSKAVSFFLEAIKLNSPADNHMQQPHHVRTLYIQYYLDLSRSPQSRSHFLWTGLSRFNVQSLAPNAEAAFELYASFSKAGVYNLNRFRLVVLQAPPPAARQSASAAAAAAAAPPPATTKDILPSAQHLVTIEEP